jgi:hypothetical protein
MLRVYAGVKNDTTRLAPFEVSILGWVFTKDYGANLLNLTRKNGNFWNRWDRAKKENQLRASEERHLIFVLRILSPRISKTVSFAV